MVRGVACCNKLWSNDWCASVIGMRRPGISFVGAQSKERRLLMLRLIRSNLLLLDFSSMSECHRVDLFILNKTLWYEIIYKRGKNLRCREREKIEPEFVACTNWINSL